MYLSAKDQVIKHAIHHSPCKAGSADTAAQKVNVVLLGLQ